MTRSRSAAVVPAACSRRSSSLARANSDPRQILLRCFEAALGAVDARACTAAAAEEWAPQGEWHVVAIGKAAGSMALGVRDALGMRLAGGIVVTKPGHVPADLGATPGLEIHESAHPLPDARSLAAGAALLDYLDRLPPRAALLFLVSGGASSLLESLHPGLGLAELQRVNAWALASGRPIGEVNAVRRALSRLKGGGLAALTVGHPRLALMISDVPGDDPAVIGSGLLHATPPSVAGLPSLPREIASIVARVRSARPPRVEEAAVPVRIVASVRGACRAAAQCARRLGLKAVVARGRFAGQAGRLGPRFARAILEREPGTLLIWGGESTITLPDAPGYGGRNQHLALAAAGVLAGRTGAALLAAGTDGIDGVTADAGAVVDGGTWQRGEDAGGDARRALAAADAGRFLEAAGDLLHTGPTLTNVGDVVLGVKILQGTRDGMS